MTHQQTPIPDRAAEILEHALTLRKGERAEFLNSACAGDASLRSEVESLLKAHEEQGEFLASPSHGVGAAAGEAAEDTVTADRSQSSESVGTVIGRYKLLQLIGEGGFGAVYMAEQREPVVRKVALKIIKLGMDTKQVIARFEAERQALAMMDHPNIAKVLDAGSTSGGRPYFVMELVRGEPITHYCDKNNLTVEQRLELFQQVCHAVQHAHQKGIIHRDIKPSNVMITLHDGKPMPKVIDFGIAKATNARLTEKTVFTEYRQFIGTPEYMSPEQAEMSGIDIDTRSDVYSLGVLLYELLTGTTPFDPKKLRSAGYGEIQRIIREETPHKPSTRLSTLDTLPSIAAHRQIEPRRLGLMIRGDLDWIVMKALEKDRTRRYETANGFAMDVERYLNDEPVTATPPSAGYKLKKLIKRNKGAFSAAAVVFIVLTLGVIGTTWGLISTRAEYERAERELARANEVKRLITEMLQSVNPAIAQTTDTSLLRRILSTASDRLKAGDVTDELVAADLHRIIGNVYVSLSAFPEGERHLRSAVEINKRVLGPTNEWTRRSEWGLGMICLDSNRFQEAKAIFERIIDDAKRTLGEQNRDVLLMMTNLAYAYHGLSRYAEAETLYLQTLELKRQVLGIEDPDTLRCMNNLATLYWNIERYAEAEPLMKQTLEVREHTLGPEHPETLTVTANLANVYRMQDKRDKAEQLYERSIPMMRRVLGDRHAKTTLFLHNLAALYIDQGRFEDAVTLMREVIENNAQTLGSDNEQTLGARTDLGRVYLRMRRYEDALQQFELCLPTMRQVLGEKHPFTRYAMDGMFRAHAALGHSQDAQGLHGELDRIELELVQRPGAPANELNTQAWHLLTCGYVEFRDPKQAMSLAERACSLEDAGVGANLWVYLDTLALAQHMTGDTAAAVETQKRAISLMPDANADPEMTERLAKYEAALTAASTAGEQQAADD